LEESSAGSKRLELSIDDSAVAKISANQSGQEIAFETVGSERMRITSTGAVGIGLTNPNTKLQVSGSTTIGGYNAFYFGTGVNSLNITAPLYPVLAFYYGTNLAGIITGYSDHIGLNTGVGGSKYISFEPGDSEIMRITAAGNVGIGTTSPAAKLDITSATDTFSLINATNTAQGNRAALFMAARNVNGNVGNVSIEAISVNNQQNDMVFRTGATTMGGFGTERMRITTAGTLQLNVLATYGSMTYEPSITYKQSGATGVGGIYFGNSYNSNNNVGLQLRVSNDATQIEALTINYTGNVGIGTTSPGAKLDVNGDVYVSPNTAGKNTFILSTNASNDARLLMKSDTTTKVDIQANGTSYFNGGNVGIGTTAPFGTAANRTVLSVNGTTDVSLNIGSGGSQRAYLYGVSSYAELGTIGSLPLRFAPNNSEKMRLDANGNLGIGTTSPSSPLAVQSNANQLRLQTQDAPSTIFAVIGARYDTTHPFTIEVANNNSTASEFMGVYADGGGIANRVVFPTGNVGIGTTSPSQLLELYGTSTAMRIISTSGDAYIRLTDNGVRNWDLKVVDVNDYFEVGGTSATSLVVTGAGNVGIGTTNPAYKLDVRGNVLIGDNTTNTVRIGSYASESFIFSTSAIPLTFYVNGSEKMRIASDGNVGIGTTSPIAKLHVSYGNDSQSVKMIGGSGSTNGNFIYSLATDYSDTFGLNVFATAHTNAARTNNLVRIHSNETSNGSLPLRVTTQGTIASPTYEALSVNYLGNVGIGTTAPAAKLHVAGLVTLDSTIVYSKVNSITTNNPIRIIVPFTKINTGADFIVKVKAIAMANNSSGVNYLDYVGYSGYTFNFNANLTTIEKLGNVVVNSYVSASSGTAGNLYIELNGDDGYLQDSNWTIQTDILGNSMYSTFDS